MWWCVKSRLAVVAVACVISAAQGQQQNTGEGVLLPALQPQGTQQQSHGGSGIPITHTAPQSSSPQFANPGSPHAGVGVPLPHPGTPQQGVPPHNLPLPTSGAHHPVAPPMVVPLDTGSHGVPLPPYTVENDAGSMGSMPGGLQGVRNPQEDHDVKRVMQMPVVARHLQAASRADSAVKITEIITAHKQIVSGQLIYLTVRLSETVCPRNTLDTTLCQIDPTEDTHICELVVWERPWLNSTKIIQEKSRCAETDDDTDFKTYGGHLSLPASSPSEVALTHLPSGVEEQQVVAEAFSFVDRGSDSDFRGRLVDYDINNIKYDSITNTTRVQVDVEYGFSVCLKSPNQAADPRPCPHDLTRQHYICSVIVLHSPNHVAALEVVPILDDIDDIHCEKKRLVGGPGGIGEELVVAVEAPCTGCPQPVPLTDPTVLELADFAITEYDRTTDDDELHTIVRIIKAHSQVVSGVKYFLTVEIADTNCKKMVMGVDVNRTFCNPDPTDSTDICELHVVDQPWIPARDLVLSRCQDKDNYSPSNQDEFIVPVSHSAGAGHQLGATPPSHHGAAPQNVEVDAATMEVVKGIVSAINRLEDDVEYQRFVKVHKASKQVVSGATIYHVAVEVAETLCNKHDPNTGTGEHCALDPSEEPEVCEAEVHEQVGAQPPQHARRILSLNCDDLDDYLRQKMMPTVNSFATLSHPFLDDGADTRAGFQRLATNDSAVAHVAGFVLNQYNLRGDEDELYALTRVVSAQSQASGEGTRYHLELELAETHCKKYLPVSDPSRCPIDYSEDREICQAEALLPQTPGAQVQVTRLYCDEIDDYYTRKLRGSIGGQAGSFSHQAAQGGPGGVWATIDVNDPTLKKLGHLVADEYDSRSDDDNLFIFHKVIQARKQVAAGIRYHLVVELQETVCPKYKRRIHKSRCVPDIGEEHMVCEANVLSQPWLRRQDISHLRCAEKDDFLEGDDSVEVLLPHVHPSAHARPKFKSQFIVRGSVESEESNERFYDPSRRTSSRSLESKEDDSDEIFYHPSGRRNSRYDSDEDDDDDDDDSDEVRRIRGKRMAMGGATEVTLPDPEVDELAQHALISMDRMSDDTRLRVVEKVLSARKKLVSGIEWTVKMSVRWTKCQRDQTPADQSTCEIDPTEDPHHCTATIYQQPWLNYRKVTQMQCSPASRKQA